MQLLVLLPCGGRKPPTRSLPANYSADAPRYPVRSVEEESCVSVL